jgi:hypothetical protein
MIEVVELEGGSAWSGDEIKLPALSFFLARYCVRQD